MSVRAETATHAPATQLPPSPGTRAAPALDIRHVVFDDTRDSRTNGVHYVANHLAREQAGLGHRAQVLLLRETDVHQPAKPPDPGYWMAPVEVLAIGGPRLRGRAVVAGAGLAERILGGADPRTIVHIHGARRPVLLSLGLWLARRNIRYAVTVHGRYAHLDEIRGRTLRDSLVRKYLAVFERRLLERAAFVHAVTPAEAEMIRAIAPRARVAVVANAAYSSAFAARPAWAPRAGLLDRAPTFGFCGRYAVLHKGLDLLVDGFGLHRASGGSGQLVLAGPVQAGGEDLWLGARAEACGAAAAVTVAPPAFGPEKRALLRSWDFFVQPSRFDVLPTGALEAALDGLPLIVSAATGLGEAVESAGAGFVIDDLSPRGVGAVLGRAAEVAPEAWTRMSRAAHAMALEIGDWTRTARRIQDLYAEHPAADSDRPAV